MIVAICIGTLLAFLIVLLNSWIAFEKTETQNTKELKAANQVGNSYIHSNEEGSVNYGTGYSSILISRLSNTIHIYQDKKTIEMNATKSNCILIANIFHNLAKGCK